MDDLPAYGGLSTNYAAELDEDKLYVPLDWQPATHSDAERRSSWELWKADMVSCLDALWPAFRGDIPPTQVGRRAHRVAVTKADLELMYEVLLPQMAGRVTSDDAIDEREHWELYAREDVLEPPPDPSETLIFYSPGLARRFDGCYVGAFATGRARKLGTLLLQLKTHFERPRAYQTSVLLDAARPFPHEYAASGCTPSFVSAHCLQALMGAAYFHDRIGISTEDLPNSAVQSLQQYAADVGDRRVFAGVHYPSDSLGSWLVAVTLTPRVFPPSSVDRAMRFVTSAIRRSFVYRSLASTDNEVLRRAMHTLESRMTH